MLEKAPKIKKETTQGHKIHCLATPSLIPMHSPRLGKTLWKVGNLLPLNHNHTDLLNSDDMINIFLVLNSQAPIVWIGISIQR